MAALDVLPAGGLRPALLTACRSAEVLEAKWSEFDLAARVWTIPAQRMKGAKEHRVPLSDAALALLAELAPLRQAGDLVIPGAKRGRPLGLDAMQLLLRPRGVTVHGSTRSAFRDWATLVTARSPRWRSRAQPTTPPEGTEAVVNAPALVASAMLPRWVGWRNELRNETPTKVPHSPRSRGKASAPSPETWGSRDDAGAWARRNLYGQGGGIGLVLGELADGSLLAGVDLDACIDPDGTLAAWARAAIERFGTYTEISPSGAGVKLFPIVAPEDAAAALALPGGKAMGRTWAWKAAKGEHGPAIEVFLGARYSRSRAGRSRAARRRCQRQLLLI